MHFMEWVWKKEKKTNEYNESNITIGKYQTELVKDYGKFEKNLKINN